MNQQGVLMERDEGSDLVLVLWRLRCGTSTAGQANVRQIPATSTIKRDPEGTISTKPQDRNEVVESITQA